MAIGRDTKENLAASERLTAAARLLPAAGRAVPAEEPLTETRGGDKPADWTAVELPLPFWLLDWEDE